MADNEIVELTESNAERHAALIVAWELSLRSPNTRRAYDLNLRQYMDWLDTLGADLLTAKRPIVDAYRGSLAGAASTVARKLSAVSSFYAYAVSAEAISANPAALVNRPRVDPDESATQGLTQEQAKALLHAAHEDGPRSYALIALMLGAGVRVSEALGATTDAYGFDPGYRVLRVTRKGGKRASVALSPLAIAALDEYLGTTGADVVKATTDATPIFTTATGKPWNQSEAFRTVQRLAKAAGIPGKISPHSMRHTYATIALDKGMPLHDVQDSLGHADPRTTRRYDRARGRLSRSASFVVGSALSD